MASRWNDGWQRCWRQTSLDKDEPLALAYVGEQHSFVLDELENGVALLARAGPHAMHNAFEQFAAFSQDAIDNKTFAATEKLPMPFLAIGADHSYAPGMAAELSFAASDVTGKVIANSGHGLIEEQPAATFLVRGEPLNCPKADCADDHYNQNPNQK